MKEDLKKELEALKKRVKELEAQPKTVIIQYPITMPATMPITPQPQFPFYPQIWCGTGSQK